MKNICAAALSLLLAAHAAQAQDIANPTCKQILDMYGQLGDKAVPLIQGYVFRDWEKFDTVPAPGQGPIAPIMEANTTPYGNAVQAYCEANPGQLLDRAAYQTYMDARISLYGKLPD